MDWRAPPNLRRLVGAPTGMFRQSHRPRPAGLSMVRNAIRHRGAPALGLLLLAFALPLGATERRVEAPRIVPRAAWGAEPPDTSRMKPHTPREIVIHHSAEPR